VNQRIWSYNKIRMQVARRQGIVLFTCK